MNRKVTIGTATTTAILSLLLFTVFSCGARQNGADNDPLSLLRQGRYPEARVAAVSRGLENDTNRAIAALSYVAESPVKSAALLTVKTLNVDVGNVHTAAMATEMLTLMFELPSASPELSVLAGETALGAVSYGPLSPGTEPVLTPGAASRNLSGAVLERVSMALETADFHVDRQRLMKIWNACYSLDGGVFVADNDYQAWRLFKSIGTIGVSVAQSDPTGDLTNALLNAAVTVVEANPAIAMAARCDLASPVDSLRSVIAHKRSILVRLETALKSASGCQRGALAPTAPSGQ